MLLSLGTKGMLSVQQPTAFEDITLELTEKSKAMQIVEGNDDYQAASQRDEDMENAAAEDGAGESGGNQEQGVVLTEAGGDEETPEANDSHFQE